MIKENLDKKILLTDGAMGTYYKELTNDWQSFSEMANINNPDIIIRIHREYIRAGAKLLRTNTFSANTYALNLSKDEIKEIISSGYSLAQKAVNLEGEAARDVEIGASIGPVRETGEELKSDIIKEYEFIVDSFLELGANVFVFETFSSPEYICDLAKRIKSSNKDAFVLAQFAFSSDGYTRDGISVSKLFSDIKNCEYIDSYGFNCGASPSHILKLFNKAKKEGLLGDVNISALPNASYPEIISDRTVYVNNPLYFANVMGDIVKSGAKIVGGCCGTTPRHIEEMAKMLGSAENQENEGIKLSKAEPLGKIPLKNNFMEKVRKNEFVIAVELDPPFDTNVDLFLENARKCSIYGIDMVTVADSPRGVARVDSMQTAAKIKREIGIEAMPHICCRDKNINALKSGLLATHIDNIRNVLAVTGDPILESDRATTKSVFNLNSFKLMELINTLNEEPFEGDELHHFGALNLNVNNVEAQIERMLTKHDLGTEGFFTQPIFDLSASLHLEKIKKDYGVKIFAGIMPVVNYRNALFLNNEVPGISIPESYINRFRPNMSIEEGEETGIQIAMEIAESIREYVDGFYMMAPFNRVRVVFKTLDLLKEKKVI